MDRVLRSGMVLKRLLDSSTVKMVSIRKSIFRVTSSQMLMMLIPSQLHTLMDSLLPLKSHHPPKPNLALDLSGGLMAMARAPRSGTLSKRLLDSVPPKKSSTSR